MRIALVHDYLNQYGGAERVLEVLHDLFPDAPIYTLLYDPAALPQYASWDIRPSWLRFIPGSSTYYRFFIMLFPWIVTHFSFASYDIVLSVSHAWVKGIHTKKVPHLAYCLTPIRYAWDLYDEYRKREYIPRFAQWLLPFLRNCIRAWDVRCAARIHHWVAISETVANRIRAYYDKEPQIIYPPVNTRFFHSDAALQRGDAYLIVSRLKAYKRFDIVIEAFNALERPLMVVGNGSELERLQKLAKPHITFHTNATDEDVRLYYQKAKAFVFAGYEDFGISLAEAQACGCPVIAYRKGGAGEIVQEGISGILYNEQTAASLHDAVLRFEKQTFNPSQVRNASLRFDQEVFKTKIKETISHILLEHAV